MRRLFGKRRDSVRGAGDARAANGAAGSENADVLPELERRLERLDWPGPSDELRERVLERVLGGADGRQNGSADRN